MSSDESSERPSMYQACLLHSRADRVLRTIVNTHLEQFNLTLMEWLLLGTVNEAAKEGITLSRIAEVLDVSQPQVTALMNKVLEQRLVRQKIHKQDRRSRTVAMTIRGKRLLDRIEAAISEYMKSWLNDLPREQLRFYIDTVSYISEHRLEK